MRTTTTRLANLMDHRRRNEEDSSTFLLFLLLLLLLPPTMILLDVVTAAAAAVVLELRLLLVLLGVSAVEEEGILGRLYCFSLAGCFAGRCFAGWCDFCLLLAAACLLACLLRLVGWLLGVMNDVYYCVCSCWSWGANLWMYYGVLCCCWIASHAPC